MSTLSPTGATTGTFRNYLELARVSNLPTCVSNVLVGCALGSAGQPGTPGFVVLSWPPVVLLSIAAALLYVGGMVLNDVCDAEIDRATRSGRPIPSGRISRGAALRFSVAALAGGLVLVWMVSAKALPYALLLVICIVGYDVLHKRWAPAAALLGLCRGMLYVLAAVAVAPRADILRDLPVWWLAGALAGFVTLITIIAQREDTSEPGWRRHLAALFVPIVLLPAIVVRPDAWPLAGLAGAVLIAWLIRCAAFVYRAKPKLMPAVLGWIAGISLVDLFYLALLGRLDLAAVAFGAFAVTIWSHRRIMGT
ncbi:MAG: UbiA family prenyltransferase [Planctomycetes bacterium]|nr:UbiA family prenyltransferase [Planctomycetota bacterium]